jgi:arylsulfatase A-like enzyme
MVDDLGWSDVRYNGSKVYVTPHVDRLAQQGMDENVGAGFASGAP